MTFPQTQTILDGGVVNNVTVGDIQTVLITGDKVQLKQALHACIKTLEREPKQSVQERLGGEKAWLSKDFALPPTPRKLPSQKER